MLNRISAQPVVFWGLVQQLASAVIALGLLFDIIDWDAKQIGGVMLVIAIIGSFLVFFVQRQVTPLVDPRNKEGQLLTP